MTTKVIIIISFILIILICIFLHELVHYAAMRKLNLNVKEISIGIGPKLYIKKLKHTSFVIRLCPLVAYVLPDNEFNIIMSKKYTVFQKIYIFASAIIANLILSIIFYTLYKYMLFKQGYETVLCIYLYFTAEFNLYMVFGNLLPVLGITDGSKILKILLDKNVNKNIFSIIINTCGTIIFVLLLLNL